VVRTTTSIMGRAFSGRIRLELDLADNLPPVEGDDTRLESAVMNLLVNAVDAMPGGGVVSVRTQVVNVHSWKPGSSPAVGPGRWLRLTVGDTGSGMSSETRRRVFEPFFTTKPPGKGTGLGLYSVYRLVQEMEGHIDIDSAPGRGTTIDIYLPVPGGERSSAGRYTGRASVPPRLRGYETTVLVVDDEDVVLQSVGAMLRRLGYNTLTAASGREALSLLRNTATTVDIVLLDVQMEGMDGEEVLRSMEHDPHRPRVLFMSGCSDPETIEGLDSGGACGFLPKPFTTEQLGERLRSVIEA
jgi:CheY-like chemotaxis protein